MVGLLPLSNSICATTSGLIRGSLRQVYDRTFLSLKMLDVVVDFSTARGNETVLRTRADDRTIERAKRE